MFADIFAPIWANYRVENHRLHGKPFYATSLTTALAFALYWGGQPRFIPR